MYLNHLKYSFDSIEIEEKIGTVLSLASS